MSPKIRLKYIGAPGGFRRRVQYQPLHKLAPFRGERDWVRDARIENAAAIAVAGLPSAEKLSTTGPNLKMSSRC
jgi:hypothetical protein